MDTPTSGDEMWQYQGSDALHMAIQLDHNSIAKLLLARGANIKTRNGYGFTPLDTAALKGRADIVTLLLDRGADVEARSRTERTPLHFAINYNREGAVRLLLRRGADARTKDNAGVTPLDLALSTGGNDNIISLLFPSQLATGAGTW